MVINTADGLVANVATMEEVAELYSLSAGFNSKLNYVTEAGNYTTIRIDELSEEIKAIKEVLNRIMEMYGVVQLRCSDDSIGSPGNLSDLIG